LDSNLIIIRQNIYLPIILLQTFHNV